MSKFVDDVIKLYTLNEKIDRWNNGIYTEKERQEIEQKANELFPPEKRKQLADELTAKFMESLKAKGLI